MRKKLFFVGILIITVIILVFTVQAMASDSQNMENPSSLALSGNTINIGQDFPSPNVIQPVPTSFTPIITREQALSIAREPLKEFYGVTNPETLPVATTLALFSGDAQDGRAKVNGVPVWVVVIKQVPVIQGGPAGGAGIDPLSGQLNIAIDAQTGAIVHGVISGKVMSP